jgi:hypothetical protein
MDDTKPCPMCGRANGPQLQYCECGHWNANWNPRFWTPPRGVTWFTLLTVAVAVLSIATIIKQIYFPD